MFTPEPWHAAQPFTPWCTALTEYCVKSPGVVWQAEQAGGAAYVGGAIGMWPTGGVAVVVWFSAK
ncbi:MAG TPA: hypothetical protein VF764_04400, partial [Steroidobacteraceae bacterium]